MLPRSLQIIAKESCQLRKWNEIDTVIEIDMACIRNDHQFLRFPASLYASSLNSLECAFAPVINSMGRGEIVSISVNG